MNALLPYLMIMIGFALLIKGADIWWKVLGHRPAIQRFGHGDQPDGRGLRNICPELAVNLLAALRKTTDIAIGNVIGSNIANILLIGIAGLISPLQVNRKRGAKYPCACWPPLCWWCWPTTALLTAVPWIF